MRQKKILCKIALDWEVATMVKVKERFYVLRDNNTITLLNNIQTKESWNYEIKQP